MNSEWMSIKETADYLGIRVRTLRNWRAQRRGPPSYKRDSLVRYKRSEVDVWLEKGREQTLEELVTSLNRVGGS